MPQISNEIGEAAIIQDLPWFTGYSASIIPIQKSATDKHASAGDASA